MILSIAFDAFLQQVLSTEQQPQAITLAGSNLTAENILPRTISFTDDSEHLKIRNWSQANINRSGHQSGRYRGIEMELTDTELFASNQFHPYRQLSNW